MAEGTLFKVNGVSYPPPVMSPVYETQRLVEGMRNNLGQDISQPIGIELEKFSSLEWARLSADQWENILADKVKHRINLTYYSPLRKNVVTRQFYWGNSSAEVIAYEDAGSGLLKPKIYARCKLNLIDSGY